MVEITEKDWDTSVRNSHIQDAEKLFFMSSWFIFHFKKPFVSNILNLNHVSLIVGDVTDKDTIIDVFLTTGIIGRYNATVTSRISSSIINPPVLKFADPDPGNGNGGHQYGADNQNNENGNGAAYHNARVCNVIANGGNHGGGIGNGNGGNHNNGIGHGYGVGPIGIWIHRTEVYSSGRIVRPSICTNIFANDYNSWIGLSLAIHDHLRHLIGDENEGDIEVEKVMGFGRWEGLQGWQFYRPLTHSWNVVKWLITDVFLYKAMFDEEHFLREMPYENGNVRIVEGGVFQALELMDLFAPVQVCHYDEIGGDEDGNGNGNGDDGENDNGVRGDDHGGNGNAVDGDGGRGSGNDGDDGGSGNGNGGNFGEGRPGLLICCSVVLSLSLALAILVNRSK